MWVEFKEIKVYVCEQEQRVLQKKPELHRDHQQRLKAERERVGERDIFLFPLPSVIFPNRFFILSKISLIKNGED